MHTLSYKKCAIIFKVKVMATSTLKWWHISIIYSWYHIASNLKQSIKQLPILPINRPNMAAVTLEVTILILAHDTPFDRDKSDQVHVKSCLSNDSWDAVGTKKPDSHTGRRTQRSIECAKGHHSGVSRCWPAHSCVWANGGRHRLNDLLRIGTR